MVLKCPLCKEDMQEISKYNVVVDICPNCRGVWLDRGEMEKIIQYLVKQDEENYSGSNRKYHDKVSKNEYHEKYHDKHYDGYHEKDYQRNDEKYYQKDDEKYYGRKYSEKHWSKKRKYKKVIDVLSDIFGMFD